MGYIIGMVLVLLSIDAYGMSLKRTKATAQKNSSAASAAVKPPTAPRAPDVPRSPAASDPKGSDDRGIQDMGCNDRDRKDPNKPCKNGAPVAATPARTPVPAPVIPVVISTPVPPPPPPVVLPSPAAPGVPEACARFHPNLGKERPLDSRDGAEFEYRRARDQALSLSDADLTNLLFKEGVGACRLVGSRPQCPQCFCDYYFQTRAGTWHGSGGWPLNPASWASTGCVSQIQWGGYFPSMATSDLMKNAAEQARHALCHPADPCRLHPKNLGVPIHNSDVLGQ
jgi:hypothetical protein